MLVSAVVPSMAQHRQQHAKTNRNFTPAKEGLPAYYEQQTRALFKSGKWAEGLKMVEKGFDRYGQLSTYNELLGMYWLHYKKYDKARFFLIRSLRDDSDNLNSKAMLMKVEEMTKHYSTAIVYCNELLEASPYDFALWNKKIELYRLEGNQAEATRLLQRLAEIYPDKVEVKNAVEWDYDQKYRKFREKKNLSGQEEMLRKLVAIDPSNAEYQMALCNLLVQTGRMEQAVDVAGHAATLVKHPLPFIEKKAAILGGMTRYNEALAYLSTVEHSVPGARGGQLSRMKNNLEEEAARAAVQNDPYTAYARLYEKNHSEEALTYLLNTSISRGYLDDALMYIREARRRRGDTQRLLYSEYTIQRRLGNTRAAVAMLERIHRNAPGDRDICEELCMVRMEEVTKQMDFGHYAEAAAILETLRSFNVDSETKATIEQRLLTCYIQTGQRQKAIAQLKNTYKDPNMQSAMYDEIVTPYIKQLISEGRLRQAEEEILKVLDRGNPSADVLRMGINTALLQKKNSDAATLVDWGRRSYPNDPYFVLKEAQLKAGTGDYEAALEKLRPMLREYSGDSAVIGAYAGCCEELAAVHLKAKRYDDAMRLVDEAMQYYPNSKSLILLKTQIYEGKKEWEKAIEQYAMYKPTLEEKAEYNRHLATLKRHVLRNAVLIDYQHARPSSEDRVSSMAQVAYTRYAKRNAYTFGFAYAGRDGFTEPVNPGEDAGGSGIQLSGEWEHEWTARLTTTAVASWANKFFPKLRLEVGGTYSLPKDYTAKGGLSYRLIGAGVNTSLVSLGVGATKPVSNFEFGADLRLFTLFGGQSEYFGGHFFINGSVVAKLYPIEGSKSNLFVSGSLGNAPEVSLIDNSMPVKFNQLNTMLGFGGVYSANAMLDFGLSGQWYNMSVKRFSEENTSNNKNYLYLNANVTVHF